MRLQTDGHYGMRATRRDEIDVARDVADGDETVYTNPKGVINVNNPVINQFTFRMDNFGFHEARLDFAGISECAECGDVTNSCECF